MHEATCGLRGVRAWLAQRGRTDWAFSVVSLVVGTEFSTKAVHEHGQVIELSSSEFAGLRPVRTDITRGVDEGRSSVRTD